jgi:predicted DNA-binding transcriptional regulator AlpA
VSREPDQMLTTEDAAARVGLSPVTLKVWRWRRNPHAPPHVTVGARNIRYSAAQLERWKERRTHQPGTNASTKNCGPQRQQRRRGPQ